MGWGARIGGVFVTGILVVGCWQATSFAQVPPVPDVPGTGDVEDAVEDVEQAVDDAAKDVTGRAADAAGTVKEAVAGGAEDGGGDAGGAPGTVAAPDDPAPAASGDDPATTPASASRKGASDKKKRGPEQRTDKRTGKHAESARDKDDARLRLIVSSGQKIELGPKPPSAARSGSREPERGRLPFSGTDAAGFVQIALALLCCGAALRLGAREAEAISPRLFHDAA